jgi:hypothetical protein
MVTIFIFSYNTFLLSVAEKGMLCKIVLENSFFLTKIWAHRIFCFTVRHCEFNQIELIWAQVKGFVAKNNATFRLKDAKELTYAAFGKITRDVFSLSIILNMIIL